MLLCYSSRLYFIFFKNKKAFNINVHRRRYGFGLPWFKEAQKPGVASYVELKRRYCWQNTHHPVACGYRVRLAVNTTTHEVYIMRSIPTYVLQVWRIKSTTSSSGPSEKATKTETAEAPPPQCKKCSALEEKLLEEATKTNGFMRRIRDHEQEVKPNVYGTVFYILLLCRIFTIIMRSPCARLKSRSSSSSSSRRFWLEHYINSRSSLRTNVENWI